MRWQVLLRQRSFLIALGVLLVVGTVWTALAIGSARPKSLDQRVYEVAAQLQCPVCNGESVASSPSGTAEVMRQVIRQKLQLGMSEQQVIAYFQQSYGDTILESPPKQGFTLLIWLGPLVMLLAGLVLLVTVVREWQPAAAQLPAAGDAPGRVSEDAYGEHVLSESELRQLADVLRRELAAEEGLPPAVGKESA